MMLVVIGIRAGRLLGSTLWVVLGILGLPLKSFFRDVM